MSNTGLKSESAARLTLPLAVTPGEPAGIGPDLCVQLAQRPRAREVVVIGDPDLLQARAAMLGLPLRVDFYEPERAAAKAAGVLTVWPVPLQSPVRAGILDWRNAPYVLDTLRTAVAGCRQQRLGGLVTGPVHKGIINDAGIAFTGHTEFLAELTATAHVVMMLATEGLRVALATTHLPLAAVARALTGPGLERTLRILHHALQTRFGVSRPRIVVCGLNPHAGEGGHLGREEIEIIGPSLDRLREEGMELTGPLPADTAFTPPHLAGADAVLAMYHDQGLPVLKYKGFGRAVNITLGLPIIRTSVDHGTALNLAGGGRSEIGSLLYAIEVANQMQRTTANTA